jgi:hypothetical protein
MQAYIANNVDPVWGTPAPPAHVLDAGGTIARASHKILDRHPEDAYVYYTVGSISTAK